MKFSVLICTYNRHQLLQSALRSLVENSGERPDQVVVVNGGDEYADKVVEKYCQCRDVDFRLVKTKNVNLATSRNVGLPHCKGDILAMTDDDAEVFPDWVSRMKQAHKEHPEAGAVGGPVLGTNKDTLLGKVADLVTFPAWPEARYVRTLPGVNISYKRYLVERIGLQDVTLFRGEDVDFNWRIKQLGYEIYFDPEIKVLHHHRPTLRGLINQQYMYGRAYYLVRRKWPEMYSVYPHRIHRPRDGLKAVNFLAAMLYQPLLISRHVPGFWERIAAIPLLFSVGAAWKGGMLVQAVREWLNGNPAISSSANAGGSSD